MSCQNLSKWIIHVYFKKANMFTDVRNKTGFNSFWILYGKLRPVVLKMANIPKSNKISRITYIKLQ